MISPTTPSTSLALPTKRDLRASMVLSTAVGILMGVMSLAGFFIPGTIYGSEVLAQDFMPNDLINILIGLPSLLVSVYLTRRGKLVGLLLWPGAALYVVYNYAAYMVGVPLGWVLGGYLLLVLMSAYVFFDLIQKTDNLVVQSRLEGLIPCKTAGWFLLVFGALFIFRAVGMIAQSLMDQITIPPAEFGTLVADIILSTLWVLGGVMLLQRKPLGYVSGLGLLFAAGLLFIGLILFLLVQPLLTAAPFAPVDVLVVFLMGLVCFIPCVLYIRGVLRAG